MTALESALFAALGLMVLVWFACVRKLAHRLRDRHPGKYGDMGLADLWPRDLAGWFSGHDNGRPVLALLRFLVRREDLSLRDRELSSLSWFMRWFLLAYLCVFLALTFLFFTEDDTADGRRSSADATAFREQERREQAYRLHREKKFAEAIPVYDRLLGETGQDAALTYWRGMAHWQLGNLEQALQDFRRVIELQPANFEAHRSADRILSGQRRWDELLEMWDAYIGRVPGSAEAYFERAGTNYHKGDRAAAEADAVRACELGKGEACAVASRWKSR